MDTAQRKHEIRREIVARFQTLTPDERDRSSRRLCRRLEALPLWSSARTLSSFWPLGKEPNLTPLLQRWLREGKQLALPRVEGSEPKAIQLHWVANPDLELRPGTLGILEPDPAQCAIVVPDALDWIWVPGVAFDATGGRLGRGKGYYDSLLARVPPRIPRIGIAYDFQIVPEPLPRDPWDQPLHAIVTDQRVFLISPDLGPS